MRKRCLVISDLLIGHESIIIIVIFIILGGRNCGEITLEFNYYLRISVGAMFDVYRKLEPGQRFILNVELSISLSLYLYISLATLIKFCDVWQTKLTIRNGEIVNRKASASISFLDKILGRLECASCGKRIKISRRKI